MKQTITRFTAACRRLPEHRTTVGLLVILITLADGFWLTVIQGVVGAIERIDSPFMRWLSDSALLLPLIVLAVLGALLVVPRWVGHGRRLLVTLGAPVLLIALISGGVSLMVAAANSAYDYSLQRQHLAKMIQEHGANAPTVAGTVRQGAEHVHLHSAYGVATGPSFTQLAYDTRMVHIRALGYVSLLLLATNLVLALGVLTLWDDRLWVSSVVPNRQVAESTGQSAVGEVLV